MNDQPPRDRLDRIEIAIEKLTERHEALTKRHEALTERHEALTQCHQALAESVELLTRDVQDLQRSVRNLGQLAQQDGENIAALARIARETHDSIQGLEGTAFAQQRLDQHGRRIEDLEK
jgi:uncharacterized protein YoxC